MFPFSLFAVVLLDYLYLKPYTINFDIFQVPLTLNAVTGHRRDYTSFSEGVFGTVPVCSV